MTQDRVSKDEIIRLDDNTGNRNQAGLRICAFATFFVGRWAALRSCTNAARCALSAGASLVAGNTIYSGSCRIRRGDSGSADGECCAIIILD
jgi:hypothetical protein